MKPTVTIPEKQDKYGWPENHGKRGGSVSCIRPYFVICG